MANYNRRINEWWTRERVILGAKRFYADFGFCPTNDLDYTAKQAFTGKLNNGRISSRGWDAKYPSIFAVYKHFSSLREMWTAAGHDMNKHWQEWSEMEDWFVIESCGILPRTEVAEILKRTAPAVKRRLYDLGRIHANSRWGISMSHAAELMNISNSVITKYLRKGIVPFFRGNRNIYLNPADLLLIKNVDWSQEINTELENLIRRALVQRILKIVKFGDKWREHEIYKFREYEARSKKIRDVSQQETTL